MQMQMQMPNSISTTPPITPFNSLQDCRFAPGNLHQLPRSRSPLLRCLHRATGGGRTGLAALTLFFFSSLFDLAPLAASQIIHRSGPRAKISKRPTNRIRFRLRSNFLGSHAWRRTGGNEGVVLRRAQIRSQPNDLTEYEST